MGFRSLQKSIDTTTSGGKLIFHIFGVLAKFERNLIRERTSAGLIAARARGCKGGRPRALDEEKRKLALKLYEEKKLTVREICRIVGVSKPKFYASLKRLSKGAILVPVEHAQVFKDLFKKLKAPVMHKILLSLEAHGGTMVHTCWECSGLMEEKNKAENHYGA
ncbi:MAG: recombinase family protein [Candidatus Eremiobacteraeota bacterium]|nr:recombinase family protein [Candidatus Eremiobacteraeota bacterium]